MKEDNGVGNEGIEIHVGWHLAKDDMEHISLVNLENFITAVDNNLSKHIDAEDRLAGEEDVEEASNVMVRLDVVGVHGQGTREGVEGLDAGQMAF